MLKEKPLGFPELKQARSAGTRLLWAVFLFSIFVNLLMLTGPIFMLQVYDRVLASGSQETLTVLLVLVTVLYGIMALLDYARGRVLARFGARFQTHLDERVFNAVLKRALHPSERAAPANGLRDLETVQTLFTSPVMLALFDVPWTPFFVAAIFIFHPLLGWLAVFGGLLLISITLMNNVLTRPKTLDAQSVSGQANSFAEQVRRSAEVVRAQGMSTSVFERWYRLRAESLQKTVSSSDWTGVFSALTKSFRLFLQSAMLAAGAYLVLQGEMTAGAMIAGSILLGRALAPIEQSLGQWPLVQRARGAWSALGKLLASTPHDAETVALPEPKAELAFSNVTILPEKSETPILQSISLNLAEGEVIGVIGKSGSGKSTLAKTIMGLTSVAAGELRFGGATLEQYDVDALGSYIGYLPQNVILFSGTVAENIARMSMDPDESKIIEAAKRANAHEMILNLPDGYQTVVQGDDSQLSGGQRQRIALARAFYDDPVLLVLDEPNSALDNEGSKALSLAIREFQASKRSVIIMTHRPSAISECDRLVVLERGRIRADGTRDEILNSVINNGRDVKKSFQGLQRA